MEIFLKSAVSSEFRANCPKLCGNSVFSKNLHTLNLGKILLFYAVEIVYGALLQKKMSLIVIVIHTLIQD